MKETIVKGVVGIGLPVAGIATSYQEQWEFRLRMVGLVVSILVGLATFASIVVNLNKKK